MAVSTLHPDGGSTAPATYKDLAGMAASSLGWSPDLIYAQWSLETGNFSSYELQTDHNFAGIKYVAGSVPPYATQGHQANDGGYYAHFATFADGVAGYVWFIQHNSRYSNVASTKDPQQEAQLLQRDGWATDPNYASEIMSVIHSSGGPVQVPGDVGDTTSIGGIGGLFSPVHDNAASVFQSIDSGMKMPGFDLTNPFGSVFQDGQALAIRSFLFLLGLIIIVFAFVNMLKDSGVSVPTPFSGGGGNSGPPSGAANGGEMDEALAAGV